MTDAATLFPLYQEEEGGGSPADLAALASEIAASSGGLDDLETGLDRGERATLDAVEGDIEAPLATATDGSKRRSSQLRAATLVAAGTVRLFADGVRSYNGVVKGIRSEYESVQWSIERERTIAGLQTRRRKAKETLVDGAADEASRLLSLAHKGEADTALRHLLMAMPGNKAGPTLYSGFLTAEELAFDPSLFRNVLPYLPKDELVKLLTDPTLDPRVRNLILAERDHDVVPAFAEQWKLSEVETVPSPHCDIGKYGIVGPDGRLYWVTDPATPDGPRLEADNGSRAYDSVKDDGAKTGWTTVAEDVDHTALGERMDTMGMKIAGILSMGAAKPVGEWQSLSADPQSLVTSKDGVLYLNDGTQPSPDYQKPPDGPVPESSGSGGSDRADRAQGRLDLLTGALEGLNNVNQMEANRHYATQVVFQEHEDGTRRAIITLNQVQTDGNGNVRIHQVPAEMGRDGSVERAGG